VTIEAILFYILSITAVVAAGGVVLNTRNTVYAALSLVVSMLSLAVLYLLLMAQFVGVLQIMVYAGAIVVLFLFVIMLLNLQGPQMGADRQAVLKVLAIVIVGFAGLKLVGLLQSVSLGWAPVGAAFGTVKQIGTVLYTDYVLAFEIAGVLLLAGLVGAVVLAKQKVQE